MPERPASSPAQVEATSPPRGVVAPSPVMAAPVCTPFSIDDPFVVLWETCQVLVPIQRCQGKCPKTYDLINEKVVEDLSVHSSGTAPEQLRADEPQPYKDSGRR
ncbi:hypothetical protein Ssi02_62960 [Sinosporangium siamense]|uniref:Uncharacterized protein n=1 Tax=Sinosporangium siamense TaxID=1367973 RepID=A0A919RNF0_9ACTN|nr:hypothetical protein Ssi02_62960 [Sinosporangium siamense]